MRSPWHGMRSGGKHCVTRLQVSSSFALGRFLTAVCLAATHAAAELPPEIIMDRYLAQAERLRARGDPEAAFEKMTRIVDLQKEHALTLPDAFPLHICADGIFRGQVDAGDGVSKHVSGGFGERGAGFTGRRSICRSGSRRFRLCLTNTPPQSIA